MKSSKQVQIVRQALLLREKNQYTQSNRRLLVDKGYSDCSSFVWWVYLSTLKIDIGMDTPEQILSLKGLDVDFGDADTPDAARLNPGDLLFFRGTDTSRPFQVGHVEMYLGQGKLIGHNDNGLPGPTVKDLDTFCRERADAGRTYIKTRRVLF